MRGGWRSCGGVTVSDPLTEAAVKLQRLGLVCADLAKVFGPLAEVAAEVQRYEDEHVVLWDDELPF